MPERDVTRLTPEEEREFQAWVAANQITDVDHPQSFYDYRGFWKDPVARQQWTRGAHFPDTWKQHGHPTFSVESVYARHPWDAGRWVDETFIPSPLGGALSSLRREALLGALRGAKEE